MHRCWCRLVKKRFGHQIVAVVAVVAVAVVAVAAARVVIDDYEALRVLGELLLQH